MECFGCGEPATFEVAFTLGCCGACADRVARIAARGPKGIWAESEPSPLDHDAIFDAFQREIAQPIAIEDSETHLNLADAYVEMGLFADARRQAALVVTYAERPPLAEAALQLLLAPPLLEPGGLERLRRELRMD